MSRYFNKKNYKRLMLLLIVILVVFIGGMVVNYYSKPKIERVLMSSDYSYLPLTAQNYIKEVYNSTGEIVLTEKNKKKNKPYLNPLYVIYLDLSDNEKSNVFEIPEAYAIDYVYNSDLENLEFSSSYDLRDVDGKNYTTPMQDQGGLGLCWSFAAVEQAESYLMTKNLKPYNESTTERFSVRQMDYAASTDGIIKYENKYNGYHSLTGGGNFYMATVLGSNGLSFVDNSYMEYNENTDSKYMEDVLNYSDSKYEINSTIVMPNLDTEATEVERENYLNSVKGLIVKYGGAYVGTQSPNASCGSLNSDGTYVINVDAGCLQNAGHAMQVIGWDDDYEYSYCRTSNEFGQFHSNDVSSCSETSLVTGKGAWLLKNSWGTLEEHKAYQFVYLAYDSLNSNIGFTTEMSKMSERTWDNNYHENFLTSGKLGDTHGVAVTSDSTIFYKINSGTEKLEKIKFLSYSTNGKFRVSVLDNGVTYFKEIEVKYPGIYTVDFSDSEYYLSDEEIIVTVQSLNSAALISGSISLFTSDVDTDVIIKSEDIKINNQYYKTENLPDYEFGVYSDTRNIKSTDTISYRLYDSNGNDVSSYMKVINAVYSNDVEVAANNVNAHIVIERELGRGTYKLKTLYDGYETISTITLGNILYIAGEGTESSPFLISNEQEFKMVHECLNPDVVIESQNTKYHYKLTDNITLTEEWVPIGDAYYKFDGSVDGDGHTIYGLKVNGKSYAGLFGYVSDGTIKNLTIKDADVKCSGNYCGILGGYVEGDTNISNINIIGGKVSGSSFVGSLIGSVDIDMGDKTNIDKVLSSATVYGSDYLGLIGFTFNDYGYTLNVNVRNILNVGSVDLRNTDGDINNSSLLVGRAVHNLFDVNNVITTGRVYDDESSNYNSFIGSFESQSSIYYSDISNGYYVNGVLPFADISEKYSDYEVKVFKKGVNELKDETLYSSWDSFDDNWIVEIIDGIKRIPILKDMEFEYTSISDIIVENSSTVSLYNFITPNIEAAKNVTCTVSDENIISIDDDMNITGLMVGTTTIHIISDYDGYEKDVNVVVQAKVNPEVHFYANNGTEDKKVQITSSISDFILEDNSFEKVGYKLKEWNTSSDGSGDSYADKASMNALTGDIDLYAIWEPISYEIVYNYNGEFDNIVVSTKYDEEVVTIDNTNEMSGYKFVEWNTAVDGSGTSYNSGDKLLNLVSVNGEKVNLYAIWERTIRTLTYDANGGTGTMDMITVEKGNSITIIGNKFSRFGYTFCDWNTERDGSGKTYYKNSTLKLNEDIILYAQWYANYYMIQYSSNGGTGSMEKQYGYYDKEGIFSNNTFIREGYKFIGWNTKSDGSGTHYDEGETFLNLTSENGETIYLYAQWSPYSYYVSFDANGGTGTMDNLKVTYGESINLSSNKFVRDGYKFTGWNTKSDGSGVGYTDQGLIKNLVNADGEVVKLYAQWSLNVYEVLFEANGGTGAMNNQSMTYDLETNLNANKYVYTGYKFVEWNTKCDGSGVSYKNNALVKNLTTENSIILYAQWIPITYEIIFDANGGTGVMNNQSMTYDSEANLNTNGYICDGYNFIEWNTKSDGSGVGYKNNALVKNLTTESSITLYAVWSSSFTYVINNYTVDEDKLYIDNISVNTTLEAFVKNIKLGENYKVKVSMDDKSYISTGSVTKIYNGDKLVIEYTNIVRGEVTGDGMLNYLDYVNLYNHIQKVKNPSSNKKLLTGVYLVAGDMSFDNKIDYLDYVRIYNKIKELKGDN